MHKEREYPIIECDEHPGVREPGYMLCQHVTKPEHVAYVELATEKALGVVCCENCAELTPMQTDEMLKRFYTVCAQGLREAGILASTYEN